VAAGTLGTLELLLKQKYKYGTLPLLSDKLGFELRTNAETLCAVSGATDKLNNGLAITSVFSPDPHTHVEIVKYPDDSNAMKWFFQPVSCGSQILLRPDVQINYENNPASSALSESRFQFQVVLKPCYLSCHANG